LYRKQRGIDWKTIIPLSLYSLIPGKIPPSFVTLTSIHRHPTDMSKAIFDNQVMPASGKMYRYALSILKDPVIAHDVVQDCLVKIWQNRQKLPEIKSIDSWVMRITRNQCYDWVKVNRFSLQAERDINRDDLGIKESAEADHPTLVSDQMKWLDKIVDTLPQKQREIFYLREVEELTYQEIAEVLSLSLAEVKVNLHRCREKIRETIKKIEDYGLAN
jgi:RNA polymerase sigma factor (sigma-70 family)